jgi:amino acid transporter
MDQIGFGKFFGYFSGWALLIAAMVFMVTGSVPLGTATIDLFDPLWPAMSCSPPPSAPSGSSPSAWC